MYKSLIHFTFTLIVSMVAWLLWPAGTMAQVTAGSSVSADSVTANQNTITTSVRLVTASGENMVRYLVREQLAGFDFPNDAVGETDDVSGFIAFNEDGEVIPDASAFVVNITGLTSDNGRRDGFIQRNTLQSETYPTVELVPLQTRGLSFPLPASGTATFDIIGNLTIRDVTQPTSWRVNAQFAEGIMTGTARTEFTFDEFDMPKPRVGSVLSVADAIRLEFDFTLNVEELVSR